MGLLVWLLLWWWFLPTPHLACLPVADYGVLAAPPIPFAREDIAELKNSSLVKPDHFLEASEISDSIPMLKLQVQRRFTNPNNTLILYVIAHGVSDKDDQGASDEYAAYLLWGDYKPLSKPIDGRDKLRELLEQIHQCRAELKLVILDAGHIASDPAMGMLLNEFPQLLEKAVKQIKDPDLWVLTANRPLQTSHVSYAAKRSIFGYYVVKGLQGAADWDGDDWVELDELYDFVCAGVTEWMDRDFADPGLQTPWLLRGSRGEITDQMEEIKLLPVPKKKSVPKKKDAQPKGPKRQTVARQELQQGLEQAWDLRDKMQSRSRDNGETFWSPVDYAPHSWRRFQEKLLDYELRCRGGKGFDTDGLINGLRDILKEAQRDFQRKSDEDVDFNKQGPTEIAQIKKAIQLKNDLVFSAPYYVRWNTRVAQTSSRKPLLYGEILELLQELQALVSKLQNLKDIGDLDKRKGELSSLHGNIKTRLSEEIRELAGHPEAKGNAARIESLLSTPLPTAEQRKSLLKALGTLNQAPPEVVRPKAVSRKDYQQFAKGQWARLHEQAVLERQLVSLADPVRAEQMTLPAEPEQHRQPYRDFGEKLGGFYQGLPTRIEQDLTSGDKAGAERLLRLVDARRAEEIEDDVTSFAVRRVELRGLQDPALAVNVLPTRLELKYRRQPAPFTVEVLATGFPSDVVELMFDYEQNEVEITTGDKRLVEPLRWTTIPLREGANRLPYHVVAKAETGQDIPLAVNVRSVDKQTKNGDQITLELPAPDKIELLVYRVGATGPVRTDGSTPIQLRPFPNRDTDFRFALENLSDEEKNVTVQLLAVPSPEPGRTLSWDLLLDDSGKLASDVEKLTEPTPPIRLPVGQNKNVKNIEFTPVKPSTPKKESDKPEDNSGPEDSAGPEDDAKPQGKRQIWVCAIRNPADEAPNDPPAKEPKWIKWIKFKPFAPEDYVVPEATYDAGRITIEVKALDTDDDGRPNRELLPSLSAENPIRVKWETEGELGEMITPEKTATISAPRDVAQLLAKTKPQAEKKTIRGGLEVDGYPRAFVYEIECVDNGKCRLVSDLCDVRIAEPSQEGDRPCILKDPKLDLKFLVDALDDAFIDPQDRVEVRVVGEDGTEYLHAGPFFDDRQVRVGLQRTEGEIATIKAKVGDFEVPMNLEELPNMKGRIEVRLITRNPDGEDVDSVKVVRDSNGPELTSVRVAPATLNRGTLLTVDVEAEDELSGWDEGKTQIGVHKDDSGDLGDKAEVKVQKADLGGRWMLPTEKLEPGEYWIVVQAIDRAGNPSNQARRRVTIRDKKAGPKDGSTTSTIKGKVFADGQPGEWIAVTIDANIPKRATETDRKGNFTFTKVPPGSYTIRAEGSVKNRSYSGSKEIEVPPSKKTVEVEIIISPRTN